MIDDTKPYEVHPMIAGAIPPQPSPEESVVEPEKSPEIEVKPEEVSPPPTKQAENFKQLRMQLNSVERERDEAMRRLQELESRNKPVMQPDLDEEVSLKPDDLVEWRHVQKKLQKIEQRLQQTHQQTAEATTEARLKSQYNDFDKVVNTTTVNTLREMYPEVAESLSANTDLYKKAVSAYTLIKKLGIYVDDTYEQDRVVAQKNSAKPRPLTSIAPQQGSTPLSQANAFANGLTDDLKKQLRKEMEDSRKGY